MLVSSLKKIKKTTEIACGRTNSIIAESAKSFMKVRASFFWWLGKSKNGMVNCNLQFYAFIVFIWRRAPQINHVQ